MAGRLARASEITGGHTLPFYTGHGLPILKRRPLRPVLDAQGQLQIIVTRALNCSH
jgi:hypothetical protein